MTSPDPALICPDCGRGATAGAKLCPYCGYPLMFETAGRAVEPPPEFLRKPGEVEPERDPETGPVGPAPLGAPVWPRTSDGPVAVGPHCPGCGHRSAATRVRCEVCGTELWPGAAAPARPPALPARPVSPLVRPRLRWGTVGLVVAALAAVAAVYLLAYALA
jgi:hypothetical protein